MYAGRVINRLNNTPMAHVAVTDGRHVTHTDADGYYHLEGWDRSHTVAACVLTTAHSDWFAYTDGKAGTYDLYLSPAPAVDTVRFLHTSDTEIGESGELKWLTLAKRCVAEKAPAFFVHTGDICRRPGLLRHREEMNYDTMGCPVRYTIGNHDFADGDYGEQLYEQLYGPVNYAFDVGDVHFVVLAMPKGEKPTGYEPQDRLVWLKNDLEAKPQGKRVVIMCHDCCPDEHDFVLCVEGEPLDLKQYGLIGWVYGHYHSHHHHVRGQVSNVCTGTIDGGGICSDAAGLRCINVTDAGLTSELIYNALPTESPSEALWRVSLDGRVGFCELTAYEGDILAATTDDGYPSNCGVYRLDSHTGKTVWKVTTDAGIKNNIAVDAGRIYAQDARGGVYCIDADTGRLVWKRNLCLRRADYSTAPVLIAQNVVIVGSNRSVFALDRETGDLVWSADNLKAYAGGATHARYVYDREHDQIIVGPQWQAMIALDRLTGEKRWENADRSLWFRNSSPTLCDGTLYTAGGNAAVAVDAATGQIMRSRESDIGYNVCGGPCVYDDTVYYPTAKHGVVALDRDTLELRRRYPTDTAALFTAPYVGNDGEVQMVESRPQVVGDTLLFTAMDGNLYFYDKNTGEQQHTLRLGAPSLVAPLILDGYIYVADFAGHIAKFHMP